MGRFYDLRLSEPITHVVNRRGQAGRVELWPLVEAIKDTEKQEPWALPITIKKMMNGRFLAARIARRIRDWFDHKTILPSHNREIEPRDIMILVRKRDPYLSILRSALRAEGSRFHRPIGKKFWNQSRLKIWWLLLDFLYCQRTIFHWRA